MNVYLVTQGDYSDYTIVAVYLDQDHAQQHVDLINRTSRYAGAGVEEWTLFEEPPVLRTSLALTAYAQRGWNEESYESVVVESGPTSFFVNQHENALSVVGTDVQRVRRVFSDRLALIRAVEEGVADPVVLRQAPGEDLPDE